MLPSLYTDHQSSWVSTDTLLRKLMIYAINRGVFTALVQSLQVILYASSSTKVFYWALFYFPGCKVYVNSTFAMLNARHHIRRGGVTYFSTGFELHAYSVDVAPGQGSSEGSILRPEFSKNSAAPSEAKIDCQVTTEIIQQMD
ncbi:hypothetical protein C8Q72DRAFT_361423 [Fomitopsis betulina]|nr:hypothetical protein C8Q72DRAFT_361423 [Fomitopsis betulina]